MTFSSDMDRITREYEELLLNIVRKAQLDMFRDVIFASPVLTGRFRGNNQFSEGSPATGETGNIDATGGFTLAAGSELIMGARPGDWWITNNVPYALPIEFGSSQQAPNGVYGIAAARFNANIEAASAALGRR